MDEAQELELASGTVRFRFSGHSDRGAVRRLNEDSYLAALPVFVVADGMGGHAFGDRASQAAIGAFTAAFADTTRATAQEVLETIHRANDAVLGVTNEPGAVSGTTLSGIAFVEIGPTDSHHWMAFNVGDSRIYSWDGRHLAQLSVDHSAVQELVELGQITRRQADTHPDRNIVTRALGADAVVDPDIWLLPARGRQTFLLCSDGLTKELSDEEIARIIVFHGAEQVRETDRLPLTLAERLVSAAVAAGGSDNVTVVMVESDLVGSGSMSSEDTVDRDAMPGFLEETKPRG
ncbi:serine/threonine-protein phosphatase [Glaciihabitans sp. INWT7]|uniref:PP2C family protein-serine/threonine phosphatase n=1 Tax=Glaciihabitans sp. INWT7 TaxID=2596912 RepID=UPI001627053B|nr:protein phosphatase 2C domain-containing protein [Glaciihabitans sp. INWT7]QNE47453.1 serine/threonine-protein phosphatase [Glaciihabitans sp. INWT7]